MYELEKLKMKKKRERKNTFPSMTFQRAVPFIKTDCLVISLHKLKKILTFKSFDMKMIVKDNLSLCSLSVYCFLLLKS